MVQEWEKGMEQRITVTQMHIFGGGFLFKNEGHYRVLEAVACRMQGWLTPQAGHGVKPTEDVWLLQACCCCRLVTKLSPTLCDPMDCSPPGSSVHAILQARTLEWVAIPVSSSRHRGQYMPRSWEKIELGEFQDQKDDWIISSWEQGARGRERWARTGEARKDQTTGAPGATARVSWFIPWEGKSTKWFSSVQSLSHVRLFATLWTAAHQASLSITNSRSSPKLMSTESVMPSSHLILCCPLLLLPSDFPSIRVFPNESALCMRWPRYWSFSFNISPSNEYPGLISFRIDWLHLLAVQGTLKSLLLHHSSKASNLRCSDFFIVQLSHPYMTPGKTIALTRRTFVGKVMSLLFNMLSRLVITFLPRSKPLLISV